MSSIVFFVGFLSLHCLILFARSQDHFGVPSDIGSRGEDTKERGATVNLAGGKVNISKVNLDLNKGTVDLTFAKVDLSNSEIDLPRAKITLPGSKVRLPKPIVNVPRGKVTLPDTKVELPGTKGDLPKTDLDLPTNKINLPESHGNLPNVNSPQVMANLPAVKTNLTESMFDLPAVKPNLPGSTADSLTDKTLNVIKPGNFTFCFTVNLTSTSKKDRNGTVEETKKLKFVIEVGGDGSKFILHNYKEQFGDVFQWVDKLAECCVTWIINTKEFHLYLEGEHTIGGIGDLYWELTDNVKHSIIESEEAEEALIGAMTDLRQWDRALSKDEVKEVKNGTLNAEGVKGNYPNWKINAVKITDHFQVPPAPAVIQEEIRCPIPQTSVLDEEQVNVTEGKSKESAGFIASQRELLSSHYTQLTVCAWIYYKTNSRDKFYFLEARAIAGGSITISKSGQAVRIGVNYEPKPENVTEDEVFETQELKPDIWQHVCVAWYGSTAGTFKVYLNGNGRTHRNSAYRNGFFLGVNVKFYQSQYEPFENERPTKGFEYKVSGVNLWDRKLDLADADKAFECPDSMQGSLVSWGTADVKSVAPDMPFPTHESLTGRR